MTSDQVYLDHNGTTPVDPKVAEAMWPYLTEHFGNPSSSNPQGIAAKQAVDKAREQVAALINAHPEEIVFTSGGTESNNLAIRGTARGADTRVAVSSAVEHPATQEPLNLLESSGWQVHRLDVNSEGRIDPAAVPDGPIGLGTLILAQNEVGTIQPVQDFVEQIHRAGGVAHTDGAQAVGKLAVDVDQLNVDLLSIAGHKFYAPKGVGALYVRRSTSLQPLVVGAGQEGGIRPGTENVAGIVGLGAAAELATSIFDTEMERQAKLRELLWEQLSAALPDLVRVSPAEGCLPNTLMVAAHGHAGHDVLETVSDIAASTGSACHAGVHTPAPTLLEMGLTPELAVGALRLSIGRGTTEDDIRTTATALAAAIGT